MERKQIIYKNSRISYLVFGVGTSPVACFPGYGETGDSFAFLGGQGGKDYRFYAFDLPFHGQTQWNEDHDFTPGDLQEIVAMTIPGPARLILMGFSLGGRIALGYFQANPEKIEKLVLLAPDGLKLNFWYWLATQSFIGNRLFRFTMKNPSWFFAFLKGLNKLGLVNTSIFKFVNYYIGDKIVREQLYQRWMGLRKIRPNIRKIKQQINLHATPVRIIYGKHDKIILPARGEKFRKGIEKHCSITILESGHQLLQEKHANQIMDKIDD